MDPEGTLWITIYPANLGAVYLVTVYGPYLYYNYIGPASIAAYHYFGYLVIRYGPQASHIITRQLDPSQPSEWWAIQELWERSKEMGGKTCYKEISFVPLP